MCTFGVDSVDLETSILKNTFVLMIVMLEKAGVMDRHIYIPVFSRPSLVRPVLPIGVF